MASEGPAWTIQKILSWTADYFKSRNIESSRLAAEMLLGHALGLRRLDLYLQHDRPLQSDELALFKTLIQRRIKKEPVAYITGRKGFYLSDYTVSSDVLIPRPDTEALVETAIAQLNPSGNQNVLELGVGSGAVILSIARAGFNCTCFGVDISQKAAALAAENGKNEIKKGMLALATGSWFSCFKKIPYFDLIVSNPPYIPSTAIDQLEPEIRLYEPRLALDGGADGLCCIRKIIETACFYLRSKGVLLLETGFDQKKRVEELAEKTLKYEPVIYIKDLSGHNRVAKLVKK